ncbi:MAG: hypothetical protein ACLQL2_07005 [Methylovirgula sp.]
MSTFYISVRVALCLIVLIVPLAAAQAATPRAYCARVVDDDQLRPAPSSLSSAIERLFILPGAEALQTTFYRCADGAVMLCNVGANLPCGKANVSKQLDGATAWCKGNPNADFIPMVATGHDTIYNWRCINGVATPGPPIANVDSRGFFSEYWKPLK